MVLPLKRYDCSWGIAVFEEEREADLLIFAAQEQAIQNNAVNVNLSIIF